MTIAGPPGRTFPGRTFPGRTFWVDVEDLFQYFAVNPRPSGIQRLVFEILCVLPKRAAQHPQAPRIAFVRHSGDGALLREVAFDEVARLFEWRASGEATPQHGEPAPRGGLGVPQPAPFSRRLRHAAIQQIQRLPPDVAATLVRAGVQQLTALRHARALAARLRFLIRPLMHPSAPLVVQSVPQPVSGGVPANPPAAAGGFAGRANDVFLVLGAAWVTPDYGRLLQQLRSCDLAPVLLLYDLIPLRWPEWCAAELVAEFAAWFQATVPHATCLLAISRATAADVEAYSGEIGLTLAGPVQPIPIGTGLGRTARQAVAGEPAPAELPPAGLPPAGSYVLFVSTLEARKNHALLFRIWRRLLTDLPRTQVPTLVFAGRVGWLVADLLQQLENTAWLDGKIRLLRDPTDAELSALYRGCQFTLFPSLHEGWGLPVSESLALGRPCLASNRTSLPEAGGDLARYFDPENFADAYAAVRAVIADPAGLAAWQAQVAREFRHVPWEHTADAILAASLSPDTLSPGIPLPDAALLQEHVG